MASESGTLREDFRELLSGEEDRAAIVEALRGFLTAGKLATFECRKCGERNEVPTPDAKVRLDTLKFMTEQGLGQLLREPARASTDALMEQFYRSSDSLTDTELALCIAAENGGEFPDVKRDILELARRVIAEADGRVGV